MWHLRATRTLTAALVLGTSTAVSRNTQPDPLSWNNEPQTPAAPPAITMHGQISSLICLLLLAKNEINQQPIQMKLERRQPTPLHTTIDCWPSIARTTSWTNTLMVAAAYRYQVLDVTHNRLARHIIKLAHQCSIFHMVCCFAFHFHCRGRPYWMVQWFVQHWMDSFSSAMVSHMRPLPTPLSCVWPYFCSDNSS